MHYTKVYPTNVREVCAFAPGEQYNHRKTLPLPRFFCDYTVGIVNNIRY